MALRAPRLAINDRGWLARGPVLVVNGRWVPPADFEPPTGRGPWLGRCEGQPACALVGPEQAVALEPNGVGVWFDELAVKLRGRELGGEWIRRPWDLVAKNADHLVRDFAAEVEVGLSHRHLTTVALVGPADRLFIDETARIDPYTVFDTTNGPIMVAAGAVVQPFTRVEGPCYIGRDTHLFRANLRGGVTLGPELPDRRRGRGRASCTAIRTSITRASWAMPMSASGSTSGRSRPTATSATTTARCPSPWGETPWPPAWRRSAASSATTRGRAWDACSTRGPRSGVMCNVLPAGPLLPKHVPSFAVVRYGRVAPGIPLEQLFVTARIVAGRRGHTFSAVEERLFADLYEQTRLERKRTFLQADEGRADHQPILVASASC